ncbi:hypothetical protein NEOLEDRAFT_1130532 [Neolentinus lepideus HHB14362 ss-1]|uniref:Uncharacterized protein n=1 Tax=Neolentinus lepideus HHB14362 ss-1 TaxID=1314782 RepID=A0A165U2M3_9AGAM|nr:hypothetical protein NEOLEDRAFT_1130532 [Neolentinus lepideus HHB14362 ss-1]
MLSVLAPAPDISDPYARAMSARGRSRDVSPVGLARRTDPDDRDKRRFFLGSANTARAPRANQLPYYANIPATSNPARAHPLLRIPSSRTQPRSAIAPSTRTARPIRRPPMPSRSPSPTPSTSSCSSSGPSSSPDLSFYDTPPPAPESLQDQLHAAYAHDDEALARRLCLELKTTPDAFFAPPGLLELEEPEAMRVRECQAREAKWRAERRREEKLREKESVWEESREAFRAGKAERDRRRACHIPRMHSHEYLDSMPHQYASRSELHHSPPTEPHHLPRSEPHFHYTVPTLPASQSPRARQLAMKADARCVPYKTVMKTMQGSLFPLDGGEYRLLSRLARNPELESLFRVVEWEDGERRRSKGKDKDLESPNLDRQLDIRIRGRPGPDVCASCSSSATSRSGSWLSFGSRSSISTIATSVSSSSASERKWFFDVAPTRCSCVTPFVPVSLADTPLAPVTYIAGASNVSGKPDRRARKESSASESKLVKRVSAFLDMAKGLQRAYASAVMFSVQGAHAYAYEDEMVRDLVRKTRDASGREGEKMRLRPHGYRVNSQDVSLFTAPSPPSPCTTETNTALLTPYTLVPLLPSLPSSPYSPSPCHSQFPDDPLQPLWRLRPISNPVLLRLKALQNICLEKHLAWEGRAREGALGCGRERLVGIAWERRRSGLSVEVRWVEGEGGL